MTSGLITGGSARVLENLPPGVPVLATTATANARVTRDVAEQLASGADGEALVLRGPLDRESLCLAVVELPTAQQRLGWLAEHLDQLPGSGIIYTLTVAAAHETAAFLRDRGHEVLPYTGRDEQEQRLAAERALLGGELKALVATSALGMGFDKPDLGFVVHLGAPSVAGGLLPADRPGGTGRAPGRGGPAARAGGPRHLGLLRLAGVPARAAGPGDARCTGRGGPARCRPRRWRPRST